MMPPNYYVWEHWRENGALPPRPTCLPKMIPQTWWAYYKLHHLKPKPISIYDGFFAQNRGALFRMPGGNIENTADQKAVISWAGLDLNVTGWVTQISQCIKDGIYPLPWKRCYNEDDIDEVFAISSSVWGGTLSGLGHCVLNVENEILTVLPPSKIAEKIAFHKIKNPHAEVAVVPLPWVQNGQGWAALKDVPVLLEVFTNELSQYTAAVCVEHAEKEGLKIIGCLWGAYPINDQYPDPALYPKSSYKIQAIYTGDDVQNWSAWK